MMRVFYRLQIIFACLLLSVSVSYAAEKAADKELSMPELMYMDCLALDDPLLDEPQQEEYCVCISAHAQMYEEKQEEERRNRDIYSKKKKEHVIRAEQISEIQGPCIYVYFNKVMYDECYSDVYLHADVSTLKELKKMCNCMGLAFEEVIREKGQEMMRYTALRSSTEEDPIALVRTYPHYKRMKRNAKNACRAEFRK